MKPRYSATSSRRCSADAASNTAAADTAARIPPATEASVTTVNTMSTNNAGAKSACIGVDVANSSSAAAVVQVAHSGAGASFMLKKKKVTSGDRAIANAVSATGRSATGRCSVATVPPTSRVASTAIIAVQVMPTGINSLRRRSCSRRWPATARNIVQS